MLPKINNWGLTVIQDDPYRPPELCSVKVFGTVYDHHAFSDGDNITTSTIIKIAQEDNKTFLYTKSGSVYILGYVAPEYEKLYPNALERILKINEENITRF